MDVVDWQKFEKTLPKTMTLFVVEGTRGGESDLHTINDICIDDFSVVDKDCGGASTTKEIAYIVLTGFMHMYMYNVVFSYMTCSILLIFFLLSVEEEPTGPFDRNNTVELPWFCGFGASMDDPDLCSMVQYEMNDFDWTFIEGETPTANTGPSSANGTNIFYYFTRKF